MLMSQYAFVLPADYPMRAVRERIAARGPEFDTLPGLGWKAFLVREKGVAGATDNQYAPLYFWPAAPALTEFLLGERFAGVSDAFGRPAVRTTLLVEHSAPGGAERPRWCQVERRHVATLADLTRTLERWGAPDGERLHSSWTGLDTADWTLWRHVLHAGDRPPVAGSGAALFEVAHFSQPA